MSTDATRARILADNTYYETHIKPLASGDAKQDEPVPTIDMGREPRASMLHSPYWDRSDRANQK